MALLPKEPTKASSRKVKPRFLRANLGDGYDQRSGDGIQTIKEEWDVVFEALDTTAANVLVEFFEDLQGYQAFTWIPFRQTEEKKFICDEWSESFYGRSLTTISAHFIQVFDRS